MEQVSLMNTIGIYVHDVSPGSACSCGGEPYMHAAAPPSSSMTCYNAEQVCQYCADDNPHWCLRPVCVYTHLLVSVSWCTRAHLTLPLAIVSLPFCASPVLGPPPPPS